MSNELFKTKTLLRRVRLMKNPSPVFMRHQKLKKKYKRLPSEAIITDHAHVIGKDFHDPFHTTVHLNSELNVPFRVGVHRAVGGDHDHPNPGDMLCATLAACMETTLRMIADRYNITLTRTEVDVTAQVDVRGTLRIDLDAPIEFQSMHMRLHVEADGLDDSILRSLIRGTKKSCIIYQTLRKGTPIKIDVKPSKKKDVGPENAAQLRQA